MPRWILVHRQPGNDRCFVGAAPAWPPWAGAFPPKSDPSTSRRERAAPWLRSPPPATRCSPPGRGRSTPDAVCTRSRSRSPTPAQGSSAPRRGQTRIRSGRRPPGSGCTRSRRGWRRLEPLRITPVPPPRQARRAGARQPPRVRHDPGRAPTAAGRVVYAPPSALRQSVPLGPAPPPCSPRGSPRRGEPRYLVLIVPWRTSHALCV
jgi:hypothetical protein